MRPHRYGPNLILWLWKLDALDWLFTDCMLQLFSSCYRFNGYRMLNDKHPNALGEPYKKTWAEIYDLPDVVSGLDKIWEKGRMFGESTKLEEQTYFLRNGSRLEERVFNLSLIPIFDQYGGTVGFYEPLMEVTTDHLNKRRLSTLSKIGEVTANEGNLQAFFRKIVDALDDNSKLGTSFGLLDRLAICCLLIED